MRPSRRATDAGELGEADYEAALEKLVIEDEAGTYWMIGAETGQWYRYDGQQWVRRDPPLAGMEVERPRARPAPPPPVAMPTPAAAPARKGLSWKWIAVGFGGLLVVAVLVVGVLAVPRLLRPGLMPLPTATPAIEWQTVTVWELGVDFYLLADWQYDLGEGLSFMNARFDDEVLLLVSWYGASGGATVETELRDVMATTSEPTFGETPLGRLAWNTAIDPDGELVFGALARPTRDGYFVGWLGVAPEKKWLEVFRQIV